MSQQTFYQYKGEILVLFSQSSNKKLIPNILFLHGAGKSSSSRTQYLSSRLAARGFSSLSLDFSGHGSSSGQLKNSSLKKREEEALSTIPYLSEGPLVVLGSSMGGYIALRLLKEIDRVATLVLFCPAVYSRQAYPVKFGKEFSKIIRQEESWLDTDILGALQQFKGNLLLVIGEDDEVIPQGVIDLILENAKLTKTKKIIRLPDCPHKLHNWLSERPSMADTIVEEILAVISY